jgi:Helix-turn-helix domain
MDRACPAVLERLRQGPATTLELQDEIATTHVAKPIFDLRAAGHRITTRRLSNGVALYELLSGAPEAVAAIPPIAAAPRAPEFGDPELIREMRKAPRRHGPGIQVTRPARSGL